MLTVDHTEDVRCSLHIRCERFFNEEREPSRKTRFFRITVRVRRDANIDGVQLLVIEHGDVIGKRFSSSEFRETFCLFFSDIRERNKLGFR